MVTILDPERRYKPRIGDVLWGAAADWSAPEKGEKADPMRICGLQLNVVDGKEDKSLVIPTRSVDPHPFVALRYLGINPDWFEGAKHKDPFTGCTVYGVIPVAVITSDNQIYKESLEKNGHLFADIILDSEYLKEQYGSELLQLSEIARLFLGSGYSEGCRINDGHNSLQPAKLKLSNGDWLYVWFWEWYNK